MSYKFGELVSRIDSAEIFKVGDIIEGYHPSDGKFIELIGCDIKIVKFTKHFVGIKLYNKSIPNITIEQLSTDELSDYYKGKLNYIKYVRVHKKNFYFSVYSNPVYRKIIKRELILNDLLL